MRLLAVILCTAGCVLVTGCGSIGEPLYPALYIPTHVSDLRAVERGDKIEIYFTIPALTTEGLAVRSIGSVELRAGPNTASTGDVDQWASGVKRIDIATPPQPGPVQASVAAQEFIGKELFIAVRVGNAKGRMSEWSSFYVVPVEQPLAKPADLQARPSALGVRLTWSAPDEIAFRVFRKADAEKEPALLATSDRAEYVDTSTEYGKSYEYFVQGTHEKSESEIAGPVEITPRDIFPPAVPAGLAVSAGVGSMELAWERNTESDFKEYRVYRSEEGGPFVSIAEGLEGPSYSDRKIESGKHYQYRVAAADQTGNVSEPSQPVEIIAP